MNDLIRNSALCLMLATLPALADNHLTWGSMCAELDSDIETLQGVSPDDFVETYAKVLPAAFVKQYQDAVANAKEGKDATYNTFTVKPHDVLVHLRANIVFKVREMCFPSPIIDDFGAKYQDGKVIYQN